MPVSLPSQDPSTRELLRSPAVSAVMVLLVGSAVARFAWSCTHWQHVDPFAGLPVRLGGWLLLGWAVVVTVSGLLVVWNRGSSPAGASVAAGSALAWLVLPALLLAWARFVV